MRVIPRITLLIAASLLLNMNAGAQSDAIDAETYRDQRDAIPLVERRVFAMNAIDGTQESEVLQEALEDLLKFSASDEENNVALMFIDGVLSMIPHEGADYQKAMLFRGKVLRRLGRMDEGDTIFARAFEEQWGQSQYENERSLLELGDYAGMAVHEFERASGPIQGNSYQVPPYQDGIEDLGRFKKFVARFKAGDSDASAMEAIFAEIEALDAPLLMKGMAQALCLSQDGRHEEAIEVISQIESSDDNAEPASMFIPLHKAIVLMEQDEIEAAQTAFREFMATVGDQYKIVHSAGIRFVRSLEQTRDGRAKINEITSLLIDSPIIQDATVKATFSDYEIAHTYDLHQMGLASSGEFDKAKEICKFVMDEFSLRNLAAANCAMNYARSMHTSRHWEDLKEAERIYKDILVNAPFDTIIPWVYLSLAEVKIKMRDFDSATMHLNKFKEISRYNIVDNDSLVKAQGIERILHLHAGETN